MKKEINNLSELVGFVSSIGKESNNLLAFRGEKKDYKETALVPLIYRDEYIIYEDKIYRESQRFNDIEFYSDRAVFDRLSRIQHYTAPTRLIDVTEDLFSSIYFSISEKKADKDKTDAILYIFEISKELIKYYDSDTVSVISNLAKIPLNNSKNEKSKKKLLEDVLKYRDDIEKFNKQKSSEFLLYEIRDEKPQFLNKIDPAHLTSIQFVLPKLTSSRVRSQKGAFLLFGLNPDDYKTSFKLLKGDNLVLSDNNVNHPVLEIHQAVLKNSCISEMQKELMSMGIKKSFIYPEIDKVSEFLKDQYIKKT
ncbi:MAG: FRG domain-containing protein [Candidatus Competibacteraceae bacterium]